MITTTESIEKVLESAESAHTLRAYKRALLAFAEWMDSQEITYDTVTKYRAHLVGGQHSPQNVNQQLNAIRFYVRNLAERGQMQDEQAEMVCRVKGLKVRGRKLGNWLSVTEAEKILNAPDTSTPIGLTAPSSAC